MKDMLDEKDRTLLKRYVSSADENAFRKLVDRYNPLVMGVTKGILRNRECARDATQVTFSLLASKARLLAHPDRLGGWLYGVAYKTATRMKQKQFKETQRERNWAADQVIASEQSQELDPLHGDLREALITEIQQLPPSLREAITACYFTHGNAKRAARNLQLSDQAMRTRLHRGRERLRARLLRRGVIASSATIGPSTFAKLLAPLPKQEASALAQHSLTASSSGTLGISTSMFPLSLLLIAKTKITVIGGIVLFCGALWIAQTKTLWNHETEQPASSQDAQSITGPPTKSRKGPSRIKIGAEKQTGLLSDGEYYSATVRAFKAETRQEQWKILNDIGIDLTFEEFSAAFEDMLGITVENDEGFEAFHYLPILAWARARPEEALRWTVRNSLHQGVDNLHDEALYDWSGRDPVAAYRYAIAYDVDSKWIMKIVTLRHEMAQDPIEHANRILSAQKSKARNNDLSDIVHHWPRDQMTLAVKWARENLTPDSRLYQFLGRLNAENLVLENRTLALELIDTFWENPDRQRTYFRRLIRALSRVDPQGAISLLEQCRRAHSRGTQHYHTIAEAWATKDPNAAFEWANSLHDPDARRCALEGAIPYASHGAIETILNDYQHEPVDPQFSRALWKGAIKRATKWRGLHDAQAILEMVIRQDQKHRNQHSRGILANLNFSYDLYVVVSIHSALESTPEALEWIDQLSLSESDKTYVKHCITGHWEQRDEEGARSWEEELKKGKRTPNQRGSE